MASMGIDGSGEWRFSPEHGDACRVVERQQLWGEDICWVWLPGQTKLARVLASSLRPLDVQTTLTADDIAYAATAGRIADALTQDVLLAPLESAVLPLPHQLLALERAVGGGMTRLLLADEVGLGKTIEAGLIMRELKLRGLVQRTLVLAPRGLVSQWASEMLVRFGETFHVVQAEDLRAFARLTGPATPIPRVPGEARLGLSAANAWRLYPQVIASMDSVKPVEKRRGWTSAQIEAHNRERFESLVEAGWDLVIIDEAHRLGGTTEQVARFKLGRAVAETSPFLLLLTATPHQGKSDSFYRLFSMLDPKEFPDEESIKRERIAPYVIRTEKRKAIDPEGRALFVERRTQLEAVAWLPRHAGQRRLYEAVTEYVREGYNQAKLERKNAVGFLMVLMQRLVVSSTSAIRAALERRLDVLGRESEASAATTGNGDEEWVELDAQEQVDRLLSAAIGALGNERTEVELLLRAAEDCVQAGTDAKAEALLEWIYRLQAEEGDPDLKVLVFTEFVATQEMLRAFLTDRGFGVAYINGSMDMDERSRAQEAFAGECRILVSTDAGGEGLNLQFCHVVVNYDIPWNPMRLEQRIGRVDRIGQTHPVRAINLVLESTVEHRVREVLEEKLAVILREFGVDKTGDVLDSAQAGEIFDDLYVHAMLEPGEIGERVERTLDLLRGRIEEARRGSGALLESTDLSPETARRVMSHPMPHWIERMTVSYLRSHGGQAESEGRQWLVRWPSEPQESRVVFTTRAALENPLARFLGMEDPRIRGLVAGIGQVLPGMGVGKVSLDGIPTGVSGVWSLWRVRLTSEGWKGERYLPIFHDSEGKSFLPTARRIWEGLVGEHIQVLGCLDPSVSSEAFRRARSLAEEQGSAVYDSLQHEHRAFLTREQEKADYAFAARRRRIERIGLPEVREHRLRALSAEERESAAQMVAKAQEFPELEPLLLVHVEAKGND